MPACQRNSSQLALGSAVGYGLRDGLERRQYTGESKGRGTMRRQRRKPMHYWASALYDGTVLAAFPVRKPTPKRIKQDNLRIDEDGVCQGWLSAGKQLADGRDENRFRFQNILATSLNTRRALREIVLPHLMALQAEVAAMRTHLGHIEQMLQQYHAKSEKHE